jgi:hypothetical protein
MRDTRMRFMARCMLKKAGDIIAWRTPRVIRTTVAWQGAHRSFDTEA